jgi:DNA-dependent protein kinase catalytic subunit
MAVFSMASYIVGLGDRHLENFLIDTTDGQVLGIDFGFAFGSNINLSIPELMPFRLTTQIEGVIAPHPLEGIYKQAMVHSLIAIRKRQELILDSCDIFVKEPLLDWAKEARKKNWDMIDGRVSSEVNSEASISWYPKKKI